MNVQQHLPILRRGLPGSILFPIGERFKNNKAFLTSTKFEIKFKVNKAAMLVLKQMHFQRFVFSQGGRTEIIPNEVSQKHLIYIAWIYWIPKVSLLLEKLWVLRCLWSPIQSYFPADYSLDLTFDWRSKLCKHFCIIIFNFIQLE